MCPASKYFCAGLLLFSQTGILNGKRGAKHDRKGVLGRERGKLNYVELTIMKNEGN